MRAKSGVLALLFCVFMLGACTTEDATITIDNQSTYVLIELNVAPVGTVTWGPDLLGGADLLPGEFITIGVDCDFYDIRIVDELGAECVLLDVDLCLNDQTWVIDDIELANCGF